MDSSKKQTILEAATRVFARHGFKKASIDEIAQAAGVAKGTVYLAASSKEDLFYQVLHREVRAWVAEISRLIDPRTPADQLLAVMAQAGIDYLAAHPLVGDLLFGKTAELLPQWSERLLELRTIGYANVVEVLRIGIRQGIFRANLDVEAVAALLQDMQLSTVLFYRHVGEQALARRKAAAFDLVLEGLRVRRPRGGPEGGRTG